MVMSWTKRIHWGPQSRALFGWEKFQSKWKNEFDDHPNIRPGVHHVSWRVWWPLGCNRRYKIHHDRWVYFSRSCIVIQSKKRISIKDIFICYVLRQDSWVPLHSHSGRYSVIQNTKYYSFPPARSSLLSSSGCFAAQSFDRNDGRHICKGPRTSFDNSSSCLVAVAISYLIVSYWCTVVHHLSFNVKHRHRRNVTRAIIWKSGKWGKLKFCDFSCNMGQNLKFKKSYIVKSNSGLNLSY